MTLEQPPIPDKDAFIRANTRLRPVPLAPEITLRVADEAVPLWHKTEEELGEAGLPPPFWAFAWAGGQALARHILDHPEIVRGKTVLDLASGSGLVGIAAMKAGAASVTVADIDAFAAAFQNYASAAYQTYFSKYTNQTLKVTGSTQRNPTDFIVHTQLIDPGSSQQPAGVWPK